ncbi:hypothetical protein CERZMDRAFT_90446 [Cercospora zeae-maydis SCOH1-5]|uniref:Uncharacterized protein n=1 Tax=Cercospora zeae-maydis SCOH1-5 TaxID=717836 RepID=A0A6A6FJG2_9PEZI|nr:hypothetical protein CERZMDRAFT_90446 [Cercospora zeae-maydis SCOH1-5]
MGIANSHNRSGRYHVRQCSDAAPSQPGEMLTADRQLENTMRPGKSAARPNVMSWQQPTQLCSRAGSGATTASHARPVWPSSLEDRPPRSHNDSSGLMTLCASTCASK